MNKKEREEREQRLTALESKIAEYKPVMVSCDYYAIAKSLNVVKKDRLHLTMKVDGKSCYKTFDQYLAHFGWPDVTVTLIKRLMKLDNALMKENVPESACRFPAGDLAFWKKFKKVSPDSWVEVVLEMNENKIGGEPYTVDDIIKVLNNHEYYAYGYGRELPSPAKIVLGNIVRLTDKDLANIESDFAAYTDEAKEAIHNALCIYLGAVLGFQNKSLIVVNDDSVARDKTVAITTTAAEGDHEGFYLNADVIKDVVIKSKKAFSKGVYVDIFIGDIVGIIIGLLIGVLF